MSVLKNKRKESKAEYLNCAYKIYICTIEFLSKLSARYSRLIAQDISHTAHEVMSNCEAANSVYPSDTVRADLREGYLLSARANLQALDVSLSVVYDILSKNPAGAFVTATKKDVDSDDAKKKLDGMSQNLGELIDSELKMISKILQSDKEIAKKNKRTGE